MGIAITPDGAKAYVCCNGDQTVVPIDLSSDTPKTPIALQSDPLFIAIKSSYALTTFKGKIKKNFRRKRIWIKTTWSTSHRADTAKYQIFSRHKKIKTISVRHSRKATIRLHPRLFPLSISNDYRSYLHNKYKIRILYRSGLVSPFTALTIE